MAWSQVTVAATAIEDQRYGYISIGLTNLDSNSAGVIEAGSKIEISGSLYTCTSSTTINASSWTAIATSSNVYITLSVSGGDLTAQYTTDDPVWSSAKQGYYASAGSNTRYVGGLYKGGATVYNTKWLYQAQQINNFYNGYSLYRPILSKTFTIGEWDMISTDRYTVTAGNVLITNLIARAVDMKAFIINDALNDLRNISYNDYTLGTTTYPNGTVLTANDEIYVDRTASGWYYSSSYNATSETVISRGRILAEFKG